MAWIINFNFSSLPENLVYESLKNDLILYQIDLWLITSNVSVPNWP